MAVRVISGASHLTSVELTNTELEAFTQDLKNTSAIESLERNLSDLLLGSADFFLYAAGVAKASLGAGAFTGSSAVGSDIGFQLIRAITVRNPGISSGTPVTSWPQSYASAGWTDVFGSAVSPVDFSQNGLGGSSATNLKGRAMLAISAILNQTPPRLSEYRFHVGQVDYPVGNLNWWMSTDLAYYKLPTPIIVPVNGRFYMRGNTFQSGVDGTQLFGLTYATGDYLASEL